MRAALGALEAAAEAGDAGAFGDLVSADYQDPYGHDREKLRAFVAFHVMRSGRGREVIVRVRDVRIEPGEPARAVVTLAVGLAGGGSARGPGGLGAEVYAVDMDLAARGRRLARVVGAVARRAGDGPALAGLRSAVQQLAGLLEELQRRAFVLRDGAEQRLRLRVVVEAIGHVVDRLQRLLAVAGALRRTRAPSRRRRARGRRCASSPRRTPPRGSRSAACRRAREGMHRASARACPRARPPRGARPSRRPRRRPRSTPSWWPRRAPRPRGSDRGSAAARRAPACRSRARCAAPRGRPRARAC